MSDTIQSDKKLKTWDEAIKELGDFIRASKAQEKQEQQEEQDKSRD